MRIVVIGFGSIGRRHVANLEKIGGHEIILLRERGKGNEFGLREVFSLEEMGLLQPDLVLICNPTSFHFPMINFCLSRKVAVLCEKPLVASTEELTEVIQNLTLNEHRLKVAFNMRYHPCIEKVKEILDSGLVGDVQYGRFFVGQYLPDWRLQQDYKTSYSSHKSMGGGVVLDLIHELDLGSYLIGNPSGSINALVDRISNITVDSEDICELSYQTSFGAVVNVHMNYLVRGFKRHVFVSGSLGNVFCDLAQCKVVLEQVDDTAGMKTQEFAFDDFERNIMYEDLITDFLKELSSEGHECRLPSMVEHIPVLETAFKAKEHFEKRHK